MKSITSTSLNLDSNGANIYGLPLALTSFTYTTTYGGEMKLKERNDIILTRLLACSETATTGDVVVRVCPTCLGGGEREKEVKFLVNEHVRVTTRQCCGETSLLRHAQTLIIRRHLEEHVNKLQ